MTPRERAAAQRQTKLLAIERQVKAGKLVVRQMTAAERAAFPVTGEQDASRRKEPAWGTR